MTPKQRLMAAIGGKELDRLPWSPFLAYFWENLSQDEQNKGQLSFLEGIGADPLLRGFFQLFTMKRNTCTAQEIIKGNEKRIEFQTPVGKLNGKYVYTPVGDTWFLTEHFVKTEEDFKILTYLNEDMQIEAHFDPFLIANRELGERGLYLPIIGSESKTSFQSLVEHWVGTEELVYALTDYPKTVEECLHTMKRRSVETVKISIESPAEGFIFWEDSSTTNISPSYYEKYSMPEINEWGKIIHGTEKYLIHHACGHLKGLLPLLAKTEIDMIESISPPPTGNVELWEAKEALPKHIGLIGGIEPTVFLNSNMDDLEKYVINLLDKMVNHRFILANSDSCPPGVELEKFKLVTEIVKQYKP